MDYGIPVHYGPWDENRRRKPTKSSLFFCICEESSQAKLATSPRVFATNLLLHNKNYCAPSVCGGAGKLSTDGIRYFLFCFTSTTKYNEAEKKNPLRRNEILCGLIAREFVAPERLVGKTSWSKAIMSRSVPTGDAKNFEDRRAGEFQSRGISNRVGSIRVGPCARSCNRLALNSPLGAQFTGYFTCSKCLTPTISKSLPPILLEAASTDCTTFAPIHRRSHDVPVSAFHCCTLYCHSKSPSGLGGG